MKEGSLLEWNVVVNMHERAKPAAFRKLESFGPIKKTGFFHVLLMKVEDIHAMLETMRTWYLEDPQSLSFLSRMVPASRTFVFQSPEEFEAKARETVLKWAPELAGATFHVRMRRRGFKGKLSSMDEERLLDGILLEEIQKTGSPGRITFENPQAIIAIETVGPWAGISFFRREDLERYPFIRVN